MKRKASAVWNGSLKEGKGNLTTQSGALKQQMYSFNTRFGEDGTVGTNPEELIAAAHAGCFTMATGATLNGEGYIPEELSTEATLDLVFENGGYTIKGIHLELTGNVPGIDNAKFQEIAQNAKANCPVSKALSVPITLTASLVAEKAV
ncbi:OsmC family protein [Cytophagaceae bacterium YF14B1]|uniref:OsmC family protein n=1 Tax=Xanthocytophaga flava TaxID=3048013 RepID=A0AAE3QUG8_9BACT|nr:OsmC family protein [Xanthocytophaga flavus]MDJ1483695.1 OsmC family protein [Xanthocytophaga flavus]